MKLAAITMVRDEEDIIGRNLMHMLRQGVDLILIANNLSSDRTVQILDRVSERYPGRVVVEDDPEPGYYQAKKMTAMMHRAAADFGASHILPFDADEYWYSRNNRTLKETICQAEGLLAADIFDHVSTAIDPPTPNPFARIGWRKTKPLGLFKMAFRYEKHFSIEQGNHKITNQDGAGIPAEKSELAIRHFPYRTPQQFLRKVQNGGRAYQATDLPRSVGQHWREYFRHWQVTGDNGIYKWYLDHFYTTEPWVDKDLTFDPAPLWRD